MYSKPFAGNYPMSSPYGYRILQGKRHFHTGIDYAIPENTPLYCVDGGVVTFAGVDQFGGKYVDIKAGSDGGITRLLHLNRIDVRYGDRVLTGQRVGLSGNTGWSTGPHLHLEFVSAIDPSRAYINLQTGVFDPEHWAEPTDFDKGVYIGNDERMKEDIIKSIKAQGFDSVTEKELIDAVYQNNTNYIIKWSGSEIRKLLTTKQKQVVEEKAQLTNKIKELEAQKEIAEGAVHDVAMQNQNELKEEVIFERPATINPTDNPEFYRVEKSIYMKDDKIAENTGQVDNTNKWDWSKFFVGLSKTGFFNVLVGTLITSLVAVLINWIPALKDYQQEIVVFLLAMTGVSGGSNAVRNVQK
jgi:hypothetical protein